MSNLADSEDLALLLGLSLPLSAGDETLLERLLDKATTMFETATNRSSAPFQGALRGRVEIFEGQGTRRLLLDYPVKTITSIVIGRDLSAPEVTLDILDPLIVAFRGRELLRNDGCGWVLPSSWPSFVKVVYDTLDDLPDDAKEAVLNLASQLYLRQGAEDIKSESLDNYSATYVQLTDVNLATDVQGWADAVAHHKRLLTTF